MFRKPKVLIVLFAVAVMMLSAVSAFAAVTFHSTSRTINNNGSLSVSFDASGLGTIESASATLTADVTFTIGCFNRGGNHPQAANKEAFSTSVGDDQQVPVHNGRAQGTLTTDAPDLTLLNCPGGQVDRLMNVSYTNILLSVEGTTIALADISRTFIE
jgi:hypothetical protein